MDAERHSFSDQSKTCPFCTAEDDEILVSVSPRCLNLPRGNKRKAKMIIRNKNPYPIYFKVGTSNIDVFRPEPKSGRIDANSKVSVVIKFFHSATPIRQHEEVIVLASIKPFKLCANDGIRVCPSFYESGHLSSSIASEKNPADSFRKNFESSEKTSTNSEECAEIEKASSPVNRNIELEEMRLHTLVHHRSCECRKCLELLVGTSNGTNIQDILQGKIPIGRQLSEPTLPLTKPAVSRLDEIPEDKEVETTNDVQRMLMLKKSEATRNSYKRSTKPHILAKVVKAVESNEISDAETSESNSKGEVRKRRKFLSEEEFRGRKEEYRKKRYQKQLEEETENLRRATTEENGTIEERKRSPKKLDAIDISVNSESNSNWTLAISSTDRQDNWLLYITTSTLFFVLICFILLIVLIARSQDTPRKDANSLNRYWNYFF